MTAIAAGDDDRIPKVMLALTDVAVLAVAFLAAHALAPTIQPMLLRGGALGGLLPAFFSVPASPTAAPDFPSLTEISWLLAATAPAALIAMEVAGGYRRLIAHSWMRLIVIVVISQVIAISFGALILFALKLSDSSRVVTFTYASFAGIGLIAYRLALWNYQRARFARGVYAKNVLLVGQPGDVEWMERYFRQHVDANEFRLVGWLEAPASTVPVDGQPARVRGTVSLERLGVPRDLGDLLVLHPIHEVIALQSSADHAWMWHLIETCDYFRIRLRIVPETLLLRDGRQLSLTFHSDPLRLPEVVLSPPYLDADSLAVKRLLDVIVSATLLIALLPLFLLVAAAIKLTTPRLQVLYRWRVVGLNGRPFTGYKFTTMVADADERKQSLMTRNEMQGPVFKVKDDPRITPLGRILRKYSLNELPQLWSVLKGDMSLVGPRPAFRHELERYELWHKRKLCVKPGMTCLWQVSGRNRISSFDEWVRLDLQYIDDWNLWLDVRILARTAWAVISGSGW